MADIQVVRDLERTQIPYLKKKIFDAESLVMYSTDSNVVERASREIAEYRSQLRNYEEQVNEAKRQGLI